MEILDFLFEYFLEHQPIDAELDLLERQLSPLIPKGDIDLEMAALDYVGRSNYLCFVGGFRLDWHKN